MTGAATSPRFTAEGGPVVERMAAGIVAASARAIAAAVPAGMIRALVLIGGYGRGEGGVVGRGDDERLHNNLDLLLVTPTWARPLRGWIHARARASLVELAARHQLGLDLGVIDALTLRRAPARVMWVDMKYGHRTLLGDPGLVPSLRRFEVAALDPHDVLALVVNRGTLLLIDRLLGADPAAARVRRRHAAKAIIGYGDAALWARGRYHPSYRERRARMATAGLSGELPALYELAMAHRFRPDDEARGDALLAADATLLERLEPVHRAAVAHHLGRPDVSWLELAAAGGRAGAQALAALFPLVAYPQVGAAGRAIAARALEVAPDPAALTRAYLRRWGRDADHNFADAARTMGLELEEPR